MVSQDKILGYIDDRGISALGWLLNDLGASIVALQNIQTLAGDDLTVSKKFRE